MKTDCHYIIVYSSSDMTGKFIEEMTDKFLSESSNKKENATNDEIKTVDKNVERILENIDNDINPFCKIKGKSFYYENDIEKIKNRRGYWFNYENEGLVPFAVFYVRAENFSQSFQITQNIIGRMGLVFNLYPIKIIS